MNKAYYILFVLILMCMCNKNKGINFLVQSSVNNVENLELQINKTIESIVNNKPDDLIDIFNEKISLGGDMIIDINDLKNDFHLKKGKYSEIFNSDIYYNTYVKTKLIQHNNNCNEVKMSLRDALTTGLNNSLSVEIYNQNGDKNAAYVSINWQPKDKCQDTLTCVLNYSLLNNKWKLTNLNWRMNF